MQPVESFKRAARHRLHAKKRIVFSSYEINNNKARQFFACEFDGGSFRDNARI